MGLRLVFTKRCLAPFLPQASAPVPRTENGPHMGPSWVSPEEADFRGLILRGIRYLLYLLASLSDAAHLTSGLLFLPDSLCIVWQRDTGFNHPRLKFLAKKVVYKHTSFTSTRPERVRAEHSLDAVFTLLLLTAKRKTPISSFIGQCRKNYKGSILVYSIQNNNNLFCSIEYKYIYIQYKYVYIFLMIF